MRINPFKLERYFAKYEFSTEYLLCCSDCETWALEDLLCLDPGAEEGFKKLKLGYTESSGSPSLRAEISNLYMGINPDQILVHSGAEEAIYLFMHAALRPGDHIVVHWPCYQSLFEIAKSIGCDISFWKTYQESGWLLDLDDIKHKIQKNTKAIIVNLPHNPTGYLMSSTEFRELNQNCLEHGLLLFSDEVYRDLEYNPSDKLPSACEINPQAISLGVMSKSYGLAGLRIGWISSQNTEVTRRMSELKDYTTICNSAPSEYLAEIALRYRNKLLERNLQLIEDHLILLDMFFALHPDRMTWIRPRAGPIAFPQLIGEDVDQFCHQLVVNSGVLLLPGSLYDHPGNHFRIGFARKNFPSALERLDKFLNTSC